MFKKAYIPQAEKTHEVSEDDLPPAAKKVLMLEDDVDLAGVLKEYLGSEGYVVTYAKSGVEGLKLIMVGEYDVILCDMMMPNLSGDMFYLAVERTKPLLCKRFIFMTGHKGDPKIDAFIRKVRGLMLWKPFEMHDLQAAILAIRKKN